MINTALFTAAAVTTGVLGLIFYFDYKRTSDPKYREKLYIQRCSEVAKMSVIKEKTYYNRYEDNFYRELLLAEELAFVGDYVNAVQHYLKASDICVDPVQLFIKMKQTLPPELYNFIVLKLNEYDDSDTDTDTDEFNETLLSSITFGYTN